MHLVRSQKTLWRLVSAGTLMTVFGLSGLTTVQGQEAKEWGGVFRRNRNPSYGDQAYRAPRDADDDDDEDDIRQILEEDAAIPPPEGAKVQPEGDGPPAGTPPEAAPATPRPPGG